MNKSTTHITASPCPNCIICGATGVRKYSQVEDRLFGVKGLWNIQQCKNSACKLLWLDPMPDQSTIHHAYESYYTHKVSAVKSPSFLNRLNTMAMAGYLDLAYGYRINKFRLLKKALGLLIYIHPGRKVDADFSVMWLKNQSQNKLLEVGCGNGDALVRMKQHGWNVKGVDFDPQAVNTARKRGVDVYVGSLEQQNFTAASFNVITLSHVIEHVHDPLSLIKSCYELLESNGKLVVLTPNSKSLWHRVFRKNWMPLDPPRHLHLFNCNNLAFLAKQAGFQFVTTKSVIRDANGVYLGSRNIKNHGHHEMTAPISFKKKILSRWAQILEFIASIFCRDMGEEVLMIAVKDNS